MKCPRCGEEIGELIELMRKHYKEKHQETKPQ
jgi:hypothetical protein